MLRMKAISWVAALSLSAFGSLASTCHGESNGPTSGDNAGSDDTAKPDVNVQGVDTSMLTTREKREYSGYVQELLAPCSNVPVSLAQCVNEKRECTKCLPAAKFVLKGVREGGSRDQIEKMYHSRFDPDKVKNVPIDGSSYKGPDSAPVVLVEFADFTCPHCKMMSPKLEELWQSHKTQIKYVYKYFPLSGPGHEFGDPAARAAAAAALQNKFWEMHDSLFEHQDGLDMNTLDSIAKSVGMDVNKMHADMESQAIKDKVAADKKEGESVGVQGTPTIYINGREFAGDLNEWINMELGTSGAAAPSASGAAPASPTPSGTTAAAAPAVDAGK